MQAFLDQCVESAKPLTEKGNVATYIPELLRWTKDHVGVCVVTADGHVFGSGQFEERFTIQSISKIITLLFALENLGHEKVFSRIGVEQTSDAFNSIIKLETTVSGKPLNPLINAGAIATVSLITETHGAHAFSRLLDFARAVTCSPHLKYDESVYESEWRTGDINRALAYFQKGKGNITTSVDEILENYFKMCSILSNCYELNFRSIESP